MFERVRHLLKSLVGKSKADKGIGSLRDENIEPMLEEYFDMVMVYGWDKFFPEIFIKDGGPLRHKSWEEQPTFTLGEKAVKRVVMRLVRWLCESKSMICGESGDLGQFPVFVDWLRENEDGAFHEGQVLRFDRADLKYLGWYIENVPGIEGHMDSADDTIF